MGAETQGPGPSFIAFQGHYQGVGSEVEQPILQTASAAGRGLACFAPVPALPNILRRINLIVLILRCSCDSQTASLGIVWSTDTEARFSLL